MQTINFELSKRLNDLGLLDNIETEYYYVQYIKGGDIELISKNNQQFKKYTYIKTLTIEEAIELLPPYTHIWKNSNNEYCLDNKKIIKEYTNIRGKTPIEAIEKMLKYLLDNNLLLKLK